MAKDLWEEGTSVEEKEKRIHTVVLVVLAAAAAIIAFGAMKLDTANVGSFSKPPHLVAH